MTKQSIQISLLVILVVVGLLFLFFITLPDFRRPPTQSEQPGKTLGLSTEQNNESIQQQQEKLTMQPDINNEVFTLVGSNVSCSTTEVNGAVSRICSGNIRIVPISNDSMSAGLYKINEQTKLLGGEQEQDLETLGQLSQDQTQIRLTLAAGSEEMLAEIRY